MNKITTAASAALIAALAATTLAPRARAGTIYWTFEDAGNGFFDTLIDEYPVDGKMMTLSSITKTYHFYVFGAPAAPNPTPWANVESLMKTYGQQLSEGNFALDGSSGDFVDVQQFSPILGYTFGNMSGEWEGTCKIENADVTLWYNMILIAELAEPIMIGEEKAGFLYFLFDYDFKPPEYVDDSSYLLNFYPGWVNQYGSYMEAIEKGSTSFGFVKPIPEPATGLLLMGGAAVVLLRRRRK